MSDLIYKVGNEFAPYHPSASHVDPRHRDGWNACWIAASAEIERLTAERDELRRQLAEAEQDARRIDWLETTINKLGEIHLHDGDHPRGVGIGLRPGPGWKDRTLREAVDAAMGVRE